MQISYLADHPEFIEALAPFITEHWQPIDPEETLEYRRSKLDAHLNRDKLPIALVAFSGTDVFGTAALRVNDLPGREDLTPWLGGVFVIPKYRGQGIGTALCKAIEQEAQSFDEIQILYLFTLDRQDWYSHLGWDKYDTCSWCGQPGDIMVKNISTI